MKLKKLQGTRQKSRTGSPCRVASPCHFSLHGKKN